MTHSVSRIFKYKFEVEEHFQKSNNIAEAFFPFVEVSWNNFEGFAVKSIKVNFRNFIFKIGFNFNYLFLIVA